MKQLITLDNTWSQTIIELILPIQQQEFHVPVTAADQPDLLDIERYYHGTGGGFWGVIEGDRLPDAIDGKTLLGTIGLIAIGNRAGVIRKMFVRREYRGKEHGIGQRLLEKVMNHGMTDLYLGTYDRLQAAMRFYERNGFEKIPPENLPVDFPRMAVDNVFYHIHI
ncbi:GNAT family N-acetyltransferase [Dinghuibacter silviterrae]|uniref:Acetyltransferase (GNAT) family protein n=1 Tax=Dinghuibacter silviterrae TaxID=1539049 RepID=A0A4R8DTX6_9BACT|nr:GNAT family N-acetyltransferase [Dinghuibacter silviterrae]TDX00895.1 acetyltransferase (GNAT) family protein [Dinghuibacter silviterrae]